MAGIKPRKDRSGLVATCRLLVSHVYERRASGAGGPLSNLYIQLFLWVDLVTMTENSAAGPNGLACHSPTPVWIAVDEDGTETPVPRRKMSEIHFTSGCWNEEIVAHELAHAMSEARKSLDETLDVDVDRFEDEERWCYRIGRWTSETTRWLIDNDPPGPGAEVVAEAIVEAVDDFFGGREDDSACEPLENPMATPEWRALHYVELYALAYPTSGAAEVARELAAKLEVSKPLRDVIKRADFEDHEVTVRDVARVVQSASRSVIRRLHA